MKWSVAIALLMALAAALAIYLYLAKPTGVSPGDVPIETSARNLPFALKPETAESKPAALPPPSANRFAGKSPRQGSSAAPSEAEQRGVSAAFIAWEQRAGYRRPARYESMTEAELKALAAAGDMYASQKLADIALWQHNNLPEAVGLYKQSVAQGSIAATAQLENIYNPTLAQIVAQSRPELGDFRGDQAEAYLWSRIAVMRGDSDALVAVSEHARGLSAAQIMQIERNAINQFNLLQDQYRQQTGHGFDNQYVDPFGTPYGQWLSRQPQPGNGGG
ncbi:MAG: hypothetical protein AB7V26_08045 [Lysobacterales bacterium]